MARWPGAGYDSTIFINYFVCATFERGDFGNSLLVVDSRYAVKPYVITPFTNTQRPQKHLFNESQIRTCNPSEWAFGVWKQRLLSLGVRVNIENLEAILVVTAFLHNLAFEMNLPEPPINAEIEAATALLETLNDFNPPAKVNEEDINNFTRNTIINE